MAIDYETEYSNRNRVPEHPEIFARWQREAEDYRAEAMKERRAELGLSYGESPRQFIDLFSPRHDVTTPLAMFIHGGYWRSLDPSMFSHLARGLNAHGVAVAVVGYDLCPEVTIAQIIEQIRHACLFLWLRTEQRMMIYGHSAGGHLAGAMLATEWHTLYPKMPADLVPAAASVSGVFDLTPLVHTTMAQDLRLDDAGGARGLAAVLAGAQGPHLRFAGGRAGVERVHPAEPRDRRRLGQGRRHHAVPDARGPQPFHGSRSDRRSQEPDRGAAGRADESHAKLVGCWATSNSQSSWPGLARPSTSCTSQNK